MMLMILMDSNCGVERYHVEWPLSIDPTVGCGSGIAHRDLAQTDSPFI
jgi:hypothetical protein